MKMDGNMRGTLIGLLCLLTVWPAAAQEAAKAQDEGEKALISWMDLLPGLRQISQKRRVFGGLLLGGFAAGLTGTLLCNSRGYNRYHAYQVSTDPLEITRLRQESERAFRGRNLFIIGTLGIGLIHLIDLTLWGKRSRIHSEVTQNSLVFSIGCSF